MKCEKCGRELHYINVGHFNHDGSDSDIECRFEEQEVDAVVLETDSNWTGYELDEEEQPRTITCPYCGEFPFKSKEIQTYEIVRVVMFKTDK